MTEIASPHDRERPSETQLSLTRLINEGRNLVHGLLIASSLAGGMQHHEVEHGRGKPPMEEREGRRSEQMINGKA